MPNYSQLSMQVEVDRKKRYARRTGRSPAPQPSAMVTRYAFADAHATSVEEAVVLDGVIEKGKTTDVAEAIN